MKRRFYHISNKLRECAKFLIEMKKYIPGCDLISVLKPEYFDNTIEAVKSISKYDPSKRNFGAASLALHFRTNLINLCDLAMKLILRKKIPYFYRDIDVTLIDIERFKNLVDTQWATEIGSLALKDMKEKSAVKPKLLPITEDIIKLAKLIETKSEESYQKLLINRNDIVSYRILVEAVLVATVLHNRKRVGDVQYLEWRSLKEQFATENTILQTEIASSLTENEKILTQSYKKIVSIGKGKKNYVFLSKIPIFLLILNPNIGLMVVLLSKICKYLLNLQSNEIDQLAKFMGHTPKTHECFYKLPQDVYQIAKISKILQIMEKGSAAEFKNKTLEEIDIDMNETETIEEDDNGYSHSTVTLGNKSVTENLDESQHASLLEEKTKEQDGGNFEKPNNEGFQVQPCLEQVEENIELYEEAQPIHRNKQSKKGFHYNITTILLVFTLIYIISFTGSRKRWSAIQKKLMTRHFANHIISKKAARKAECEAFINGYKADFEGVGWVRVKTFVFNEGRNEK
nr:unnamed protein product [Callosobruchus analis]